MIIWVSLLVSLLFVLDVGIFWPAFPIWNQIWRPFYSPAPYMRWFWQSHFFLSGPWSFVFWLQKSWLWFSSYCLMSVLEESIFLLCPPFIIPSIWQTSLSTYDVPSAVFRFRESKWKTWCWSWCLTGMGLGEAENSSPSCHNVPC